MTSMKKAYKQEYLNRANLLTVEEKEAVLSRVGGKLPKHLAKERITVEEAIAIQLEKEDDALAEWRQVMHSLVIAQDADNNSGLNS